MSMVGDSLFRLIVFDLLLIVNLCFKIENHCSTGENSRDYCDKTITLAFSFDKAIKDSLKSE